MHALHMYNVLHTSQILMSVIKELTTVLKTARTLMDHTHVAVLLAINSMTMDTHALV